MPARVLLTRVETDMDDIVIKDVHIGKGGKACNVKIRYDEVRQMFCLEIFELSGTEVLQEFCLAGGKIFAADSKGGLSVVTDVHPFWFY